MRLSRIRQNLQHLASSSVLSRQNRRKYRNRLLVLEVMESRVVLSTSTWTGAVNNLWGTPGNWTTPPTAGSDLVFPANAANLNNTNNTSITTFGSLTIQSNGYNISGNGIAVTGNIEATQSSGSSTLALPLTFSTDTPVEVNQGSATLVISGDVNGSGGWNVNAPIPSVPAGGFGTVDLTGTDTTTDGFVVKAGTFYIHGDQGSSPFNVGVAGSAYTTFGGTGTFGSLIASEGNLTPGDDGAPGILSDTGDLNMRDETILSIPINGPGAGTGYSQVQVGGQVTIANGTVLSVVLGPNFAGSGNSSYVIIKNTGSLPINGTFAGLPQGAILSVNDQQFQISYTGGSGHDVVLTHLDGTTTALTASSTSAVYGQSVTLTATVSAATANPVAPDGTVEFFSGGSLLGAAPLTNGVAILSTEALPAGTTSVMAQYMGSSLFASSGSQVSLAVSQASTSTTLTVVPSPEVVGQPVTLTASVVPAGADPKSVVGTVYFQDRTLYLGSAPLVNGIATLTTTGVPADSNLISAFYLGNSNQLPSVSSAVGVIGQPVATTVDVTASPNPVLVGTEVTLKGVVTPVETASGEVTGTVEFFDGSTSLGTVTLGYESPAVLTTVLPLGTDAITAVYSGNDTFPASTSLVTNVLVAQTPATSTTLTTNANMLIYGVGGVTLTANVAHLFSGSPKPTGTVQFFNGSTSLGTVSLGSNGAATLVVSTLQAGDHTITAVYSGDANSSSSTSASTIVTVAPAATTTQLSTTSAGSPVIGQTVVIEAAVTNTVSKQPILSGLVDFLVGGVSVAVAPINAGVAAFQMTAVPPDQVITVQFLGDGNYLPSSQQYSMPVDLAPTSAALTVSPNQVERGGTVTLTATVATVRPRPGTPTGVVQFFDGSQLLGEITLNNGVASFMTSTLAVGNHQISAYYLGDGVYQGSGAAPLTVTVSIVQSSLTLAALPSQAVYGQAVALSATVSGTNGGANVPTGTVQFWNGTTLLGTATVSNGVATLQTTTLPIGIDAVTAQYSGDSNFPPSNSSTAAVIITSSASVATTTGLTANPLTQALNGPVTLTASVAASGSSAGTPTGMVGFFDGSTLLGSALLSQGVATLQTTQLPLGTDAVSAQYFGSSTLASSVSSPVSVMIEQAGPATITTLQAYPGTVVPGTTVTLVAYTVLSGSNPMSNGPVNGAVEFFNGATPIGTATMTNGVATLQTNALPLGANSITAVFEAGSSGSSSTSSPVTINVATVVASTTVTVSPTPAVSGNTLTFTATVAPVSPATGTPTGTVEFLALLLPNGQMSLGSASIVNGVATLVLPSPNLANGTYSIIAQYSGDSVFPAGSSVPLSFVMNSAPQPTTTTVTSSTNLSALGQPVTLTAQVTLPSLNGGSPNAGLVQFFDNGGLSLGFGNLSGGIATLTTTALGFGSNVITATYEGSSSYTGSTSPGVTVTMTQSFTSNIALTLSPEVDFVGSPVPVVFGSTITFVATVTAAYPLTGTPTGKVEFLSGDIPLGQPVALVNGVAIFTSSVLPVGFGMITAVYEGDSNFTPGVSPLTEEYVSGIVSSTTLTSSPTQATLGQPITLTATVAGFNSGIYSLDGSVDFFNGMTNIGTAPIDSNGVATLQTSELPLGTNQITANYLGNNSFASSTSQAVNVTITTVASATTLTSSPNPSVVGGSVTLTAKVTAASPVGTATGMVQFFNGMTLLGTGTLVNGVATFSTTTLPVGANSLTAKYEGDSSFAPSTSTAVTETVTPLKSTTTLTSSAGQTTNGQAVTLHVTIAGPSGGTKVPTGTVQFYDGTTLLGSETLTNGAASFQVSTLAIGTDALTAHYLGDSNFSPSVSSAVNVTISQTPTETKLISSPNPSLSGQSITLSATVLTGASHTPSGAVQFYNGTTLLGTVTLANSGTAAASLTIPGLPAGSYSLTARYLGDANFSASTSSTVTQQVVQGSTSLILVSSSHSPAAYAPVTFTAFVGPVAPAYGNLTGNVVFAVNGTTVGSAPVVNGVATLTVGNLGIGSNVVTAVYQGNASFAPSASASTVNVGTSTQRFVNGAFITYFHRNATQVQLNNWTARLNSGFSIARFIRTLRQNARR